ncbi:MAG: zinc-binding dehydrogenase [Myxococcota bacterium]
MPVQSKMRRLEIEEFGEASNFKNALLDLPEPQGESLRVRVKYAGLNFLDVMQRRGVFPGGMQGLPFTPGMEVVGEVDAVGHGVESVSVGQRVFAKLEMGGYAEYVVVPAQHAFAVPNAIKDEEVLGLVGTSGQTAYGLAQSLKAPDGRPVFVSAAAGGVGSILLQLCKSAGWTVIAGVSNAEKSDLVAQLGADTIIRYDREGWETELVEAAGKNGLAAALDAIGGHVNRGALAALGDRGELVFYGGTSGELVGLPPEMVFPFVIGCKAVRGFGLVGYYGDNGEVLRQTIDRLFESRISGAVSHVATTIYPATRVADAHRSLESRASRGKLLLEMTP